MSELNSIMFPALMVGNGIVCGMLAMVLRSMSAVSKWRHTPAKRLSCDASIALFATFAGAVIAYTASLTVWFFFGLIVGFAVWATVATVVWIADERWMRGWEADHS